MQIDPANLPEDPIALREIAVNVVTENAGLRSEVDKLHLIIKAFQRHRFGQRSEQLSAEQKQLVLEDLEQTIGDGSAASEALGNVRPADPKQPNEKRARKSRERNIGQLPASLPRFTVTLDLEDKTCPCCQGELHRIGETTTEMLDIVPSPLGVKVILRPRYTCKACDTPIVQGAMQSMIAPGVVHCRQLPPMSTPWIAKGFAQLGMWKTSAARCKWVDTQALARWPDYVPMPRSGWYSAGPMRGVDSLNSIIRRNHPLRLRRWRGSPHFMRSRRISAAKRRRSARLNGRRGRVPSSNPCMPG